jgi:hypothetical protein
MSRTTITAVDIPDTGYNLTDSAGFATLGVGASNGVAFAYQPGDLVVLKNDSGSSATYTFKVPTSAQFTNVGITIPDVTVAVATGKTYVIPVNAVFNQSDGLIYLDCSVAGKAMVLRQ